MRAPALTTHNPELSKAAEGRGVPQKKKLIGKVQFLNQLQGGEARSHMIVRARISSSPSISKTFLPTNSTAGASKHSTQMNS